MSVFPWLLSSCERHSRAIVFFIRVPSWGSGKQWSVDTVRQVKALMSIGLRRAADAAQLQCPCEEGLHERQAQLPSRCALEADVGLRKLLGATAWSCVCSKVETSSNIWRDPASARACLSARDSLAIPIVTHILFDSMSFHTHTCATRIHDVVIFIP